MTLGIFISVVTTTAVVASLLISASQMRQMSRQTRALQHDLFGGLVATFTDQWIAFFLDHPELCEWYLRTRGFPASTVEQNRRRLFTVVRFNTHEGIYLQRVLRGLREQSWIAWTNVLRADLQVAEFREVWSRLRRHFDVDFAEHVDRLLSEQRSGIPAPSEPGRSGRHNISPSTEQTSEPGDG